MDMPACGDIGISPHTPASAIDYFSGKQADVGFCEFILLGYVVCEGPMILLVG